MVVVSPMDQVLMKSPVSIDPNKKKILVDLNMSMAHATALLSIISESFKEGFDMGYSEAVCDLDGVERH